MQQRQNQINNSARVLTRGLLLLFFLAGASVAYASQTSGTIDSTYKYAWGNVAGFVNFAPANGGLIITDSAITGYAWGANTGWINFNASQSHVTNNSNGTLGGFSWDSGGGWVSFTGVTIDTSGKFHGTATGGTVNGASYVINFDCTNCDVRTDWRPASVRPSSSSGGGGCAPGFVWNPATISCIPTAGAISPVVTLPPPSVSSTIPIASPPTTPGVPGKSPPSTSPATSGTAANGQGSISNPSGLTHATTTLNKVSTSSANHSTTTAKKTTIFSFFNFMILVGVVAVLLGIFAFRRFFVKL